MKPKTVRRKGVGASSGIALGFIYILEKGKIYIPRRSIPSSEIEREIDRFDEALRQAREQLEGIKRKVSEDHGDDHVYLIESQLLMLEDHSVTEQTRDRIREEFINAEWALIKSLEHFKQQFDKIDDEYFRDRRSDLEYVEERLLRLLAGDRDSSFVSIQRKTILVARDLAPADVIKVSRDNLSGLVMDAGGRTSHTVIIARALGIPVVVGVGDLSLEAQNGDRIIVDGNAGEVVIRPDTEEWAKYEEKRKKYVANRNELLKNRNFKAETKDHYEMHLLANIDLIEELPAVLSSGAQGIGMLRTEVMFLGGTIPPSEEEQFKGYRKIVEKIKPHETVIRMLDLSGDALFLPPGKSLPDYNPALGLRGMRLLLREQELLRSQMRAALRASAFGSVAILYPMISDVSEVREANRILCEVMQELTEQKVKFDPEVRIGTMIEIPAAALSAELLAQEVDFFSVGTNDLTQYVLGVDRSNALVANLYDPLHRTIIHLLRHVVRAGHKAGIEVGICGELASDPMLVPLMVGLECNFLSMNLGSIPSIKAVIRELTLEEAKKCLTEIGEMEAGEAMRSWLTNHFEGRFPFLSS